MILLAIFCPVFLFTNCLKDTWAPEKPTTNDVEKWATYEAFEERNAHRNVKIFLITAIAGGSLVLLHLILFCLIKRWASERINFNAHNNMLSKIHEYDDEKLKEFVGMNGDSMRANLTDF